MQCESLKWAQEASGNPILAHCSGTFTALNGFVGILLGTPCHSGHAPTTRGAEGAGCMTAFSVWCEGDHGGARRQHAWHFIRGFLTGRLLPPPPPSWGQTCGGEPRDQECVSGVWEEGVWRGVTLLVWQLRRAFGALWPRGVSLSSLSWASDMSKPKIQFYYVQFPVFYKILGDPAMMVGIFFFFFSPLYHSKSFLCLQQCCINGNHYLRATHAKAILDPGRVHYKDKTSTLKLSLVPLPHLEKKHQLTSSCHL